MENLFLRVVNMSLSASVVILCVILARLALKRAPKKWSYLLWGVVGFRLACPVSIQSVLSIFNLRTIRPGAAPGPVLPGPAPASAIQYIPSDIGYMAQPQIDVGSPALQEAVSASLPAAVPTASVNPMQVWILAGAVLWALGAGALLFYAVVSYGRLQDRLSTAVRLEGNVYETDAIGSPFILGFARPKIYIPTGLEGEPLRYVLEHERYHLRRGDHIVKALAFVLLCVHWFNPLVWLAFHLMGKDMEMSCDEKVLGDNGGIRKEYSATLLSFAVGGRFPAPSPLAFGEIEVKTRIRNALNWKRPKVWATVLAAALCVALVVSCAVNPAAETSAEAEPDDSAPTETAASLDAYRDTCVIVEDGNLTSGQELWLEFLNKTAAGERAQVRVIHYYSPEDPERVDESIRRDTPVWYPIDVTYDGSLYTVNDGERERTYQYLMRYEGEAASPNAAYKYYVRYVLVNDDTVTWEDIFRGMVSSQFGDGVDHYSIVSILSQTLRDLKETPAPAETAPVIDLYSSASTPFYEALRDLTSGSVPVNIALGAAEGADLRYTAYDGGEAPGAAEYGRRLAEDFTYEMVPVSQWPTGDNVLLTLGDTGRTLTLFPDSSVEINTRGGTRGLFRATYQYADESSDLTPYDVARSWCNQAEYWTMAHKAMPLEFSGNESGNYIPSGMLPLLDVAPDLLSQLTFAEVLPEYDPPSEGMRVLRRYVGPGVEVYTTEATGRLDMALKGELDALHESGRTEEEVRAEIEAERGREWIYRVVFTDPAYATLRGLRVGDTAERALALGYSVNEGSDHLFAGAGAAWYMRADLQNGVVTRIDCDYGLGRMCGRFFDV